jgi:hypothetical protein
MFILQASNTPSSLKNNYKTFGRRIMAEWPDDNEPVAMTKLLDPLVEVFEEVYNTEVEIPEDLEYNGYDTKEKATELSLEKTLSSEAEELTQKEFHKNLLHAAFLLGYENGCRYVKTQEGDVMELIEDFKKTLEESSNE